MKKFKSKIMLLLATCVSTYLVLLGILVIVLCIVEFVFKHEIVFTNDKIGMIFIALCIPTALLVFGFKNIQIKITDQELQFLRYGKVYASFLRSDASFDTKVVKRYINGIYFGASRYIYISNENGTKKMRCHNIGQNDFSVIMTLLDTGYIHSGDDTQNQEDTNEIKEDLSIELPRDAMVSHNKKHFMKQIVRMLIVYSILIAGFYYLHDHTDVIPKITHHDYEQYLILMYLVIGAFAALIILSLLSNLGILKKSSIIPRKITGTSTSLIIDDRDFPNDSIIEISLLPAEYYGKGTSVKEQAFLDIKTNRGNKKYYLGMTYNSAYTDYGSLCKMLKTWCEQNKVFFFFKYK